MNVDKRSVFNRLLYEKKLQTLKRRLGKEKMKEIRKLCLDVGTSRKCSRKCIKKSAKELLNLGLPVS